MSRLPVLLVQLPVPSNPTTNVPLAAGYLKAYAHAQGLLDQVDIALLPRSLADSAGDALLVEAIVEHRPALLGFSLYTWNSERSLLIAERVKRCLPDLTVIVGGPEVQHDNGWVLEHPAVDIAVVGEGEQTFAELLKLASERWLAGARPLLPPAACLAIAGLIVRDETATIVRSPERVALSDLSVVPSPYLLGYLDMAPGGMLMVEVSRWCPYACSFCLYGRNMGARLGNRYFSLQRVVDEIRWGRERGATSVHFIEANLNLVPIFRPLMELLADLNADRQMALYAELRGEHLGEEAVDALVHAGLRVAEVGLQTANSVALRAAHRRTDLAKWAAGTRRLLRQGVEIYLDVILGLPEDDADGVAETLDFIRREHLGSYDIFTLQVLPGTAVRSHAERYDLRFQERPPYYVLGSDRMDYATLRRLRRELKSDAGLDPDAVEGCPEPRLDALCRRAISDEPVTQLWLVDDASIAAAADDVVRLAAHVDVVVAWDDPAVRAAAHELLARALQANPTTLFDCYLLSQEQAGPKELHAWRDDLPFVVGYLDRVAVYRRSEPLVEYERVSPRLWLVLPWTAEADPDSYKGVAEIIWSYELAGDSEPPLGAWRAAGGAGVWVRDVSAALAGEWRERTPVLVWHGSILDQ